MVLDEGWRRNDDNKPMRLSYVGSLAWLTERVTERRVVVGKSGYASEGDTGEGVRVQAVQVWFCAMYTGCIHEVYGLMTTGYEVGVDLGGSWQLSGANKIHGDDL